MAEEISTGKKLHFLGEFAEAAVGLITLFMVLTGNRRVHNAINEKEKRKVATEQLPHMFGWGKADERIWGELLVALGVEKIPKLTSLMSAMTEHEREQFRIVVTGMKAQMEVDGKNIEFTDGDIRVRFLNKIVALVQDKGSRAVIHILRAHQFIGGKPSGEKVKTFAAKLLGLADIEDLADPTKVVKAINDQRLKIQVKRKKVFKRNFIGWLFQI
ncbi:MAG: hypothetical protein HZB12_01850 [Candidatus Yonathbacteria bacterium]|nr:hypothetical protein [Candidatus Yonathbacteria bacterium]